MRLFDFSIGLIGLILSSPLFLLIAVLIKLSSPGPVIYSQQRVGRNAELFSLYKFRSMIDKADKHGTSVTTDRDPRITTVGRFLRKTKLDELPQLLNVIKGDMSFVGPRPDVPEIINNYSKEMKKILKIRPGITSNATLQLRNEEELLSLAIDPDRVYEEVVVPAKVKLAMEHVEKNSFLFDFKILLQTVWALTAGKLFPLEEQAFINDLKNKISLINNSTTKNQKNTKETEVQT